MNGMYSKNSGFTVKELKDILATWSETNTDTESVSYGDDCEVWIENSTNGFTNVLKSIYILNKKIDKNNKIYSDILLSTNED